MLRQLIVVIVLTLGSVMVSSVLARDKTGLKASVGQTPVESVRTITHKLDTSVAGNKSLLTKDKATLIALIDEILLPHFDVDYASILVLGRHARTAKPAQRARFAKAFYRSITHRYAEGLLKYVKGAVRVLPFRGHLNKRRVVVRTQVTMGSGKSISVDYAFHRSRSGRWKAYDVIIEGISYVTNYRNQVDAEIHKVGLDQLIKNLKKRGAAALEPPSKVKPEH